MSKTNKEPDGVLVVSATRECGWNLTIRSDKLIEELDPLKIRIAMDEHNLGILIKRTKDGFVFYNDYMEKFYKIQWKEIIKRFKQTKPTVVYELTDMMLVIELGEKTAPGDNDLPVKEIKKPAKTPEGRFNEENSCYNQDPLWPEKR